MVDRKKIGKKSKRKGNAFELLATKLILAAAGEGYSKEDCYRTPASGGHRFAGANDHVISDRLREVFPFGVECKNEKTFRVQHFFDLTAQLTGWHEQVLAAVARGGKLLKPLLVLKQERGNIYVAMLLEDWTAYRSSSTKYPVTLLYRYERKFWVVLKFEDLLATLTIRCKAKRQSQSKTAA